ncbi:MAG: thioredoxin [Chitinispirillaceae bacterium]|jgi:thioredoxin 1
MKNYILFTIINSILFITQAGAQPFSRYFDDGPSIPDSSQQIADRIVQSKIPVLVDFWATWCGPCRMLNPILAKLEKAYRGRVLFIKINVDYDRQIAAYFEVQGIPAVFIIKGKSMKRAMVGFQPEAAYRKAIEEVLAMPSEDTAKDDTTKKQDAGKKKESGKVKKTSG